jgi:hypothetical protein
VLLADRDVPWATVQKLLGLAHDSGVRAVDVLLARGPAPVLPPGAPPEAAHVIATDFVSLPAELSDAGFAAGPDARVGVVAPELIRRALADPGRPVALAVAAR